MGMDVFGKKPTSEVGEYYRQSIWGWHPLWHYVETFHENYASKVEHGHTNDGDGLGAEDSAQLSLALKQDLISGMAQKRIDEWNAELDRLPNQPCNICDGSGVRADKIGKEQGMDKKELSHDQSLKTGRRIGWCNGCDGTGEKEPIQKFYRTTAEDIREFADFLADCGGFEIC